MLSSTLIFSDSSVSSIEYYRLESLLSSRFNDALIINVINFFKSPNFWPIFDCNLIILKDLEMINSTAFDHESIINLSFFISSNKYCIIGFCQNAYLLPKLVRHAFVHSLNIISLKKGLPEPNLSMAIDPKKFINPGNSDYSLLKTMKGIILYGAPGIGKTSHVLKYCKSQNVKLIEFPTHEILSFHVGKSEALLRNFFNKSIQSNPNEFKVVLFDEIDSLFHKGASCQRLVGEMSLIFEKNQNLLIIATTNNIEAVPQELTQKGRFDHLIDYSSVIDLESLTSKIYNMNI